MALSQPNFGLGAMASALRGHALPDMPTEAGGHGTLESGCDKALEFRAESTSSAKNGQLGSCGVRGLTAKTRTLAA